MSLTVQIDGQWLPIHELDGAQCLRATNVLTAKFIANILGGTTRSGYEERILALTQRLDDLKLGVDA